MTVVSGIGPKHHKYFYSLVLEFFLRYFIYPIVPLAPEFMQCSHLLSLLMIFLLLLEHNKTVNSIGFLWIAITPYLVLELHACLDIEMVAN